MRRRLSTFVTVALIIFAGTQRPATYCLANVGSQKGGSNVQDNSFDCVLELSQATGKGSSEVDTLIGLAEVYAQVGHADKAIQLMSRARNRAEAEAQKDHPSNSIRAPDPDDLPRILANGYLTISAYDDAIEFAHKITNPSVRAGRLARIAAGMATGGDKQKVTGLLVEALKTINYSGEEGTVLATVADVYAKLGDCEQARRIAVSISDKWPYIKAPAVASLASECAKNGSKETATKLASEAIRVARLMSDKILIEEKYEVLAQAASAQIDSGEKVKALRLLAQALAGARKAEFNMGAMEAIVDAYANARLFRKAREIANSIRFRPSRADALLNIARRYLSAGDKGSAAELLDQCFKITLDDKHGTPDQRFKMLAEIAIEYTNASRADRANEVLVESLRELRSQEYDLADLLLAVFMGYAKAKLIPDNTARALIDKLCSGEAFALTPDEAAKQRRVEEAADRFIERWHQTLDMNVLFDEMYTSNPKHRQQNTRMFYGVYKFLAGSVGPAVDKDVDNSLMRNGFFTFWNLFYLVGEYQLAYEKPGDQGLVEPPEIKVVPFASRRTELDEKRMSRRQVQQYIAKTSAALPLYRKYLTAEVFKTDRYLDNLKRKEQEDREDDEKRFRIEPGFPNFGVHNSVEVYYLKKGVFEFYFIEENGKLKVLTLGFEL